MTADHEVRLVVDPKMSGKKHLMKAIKVFDRAKKALEGPTEKRKTKQ